MIQVNELRIGNYVNVPGEDQSPFRIDAFESLSNNFIKVAMNHPEYGENFHPLTWYGKDLKPIPLTEEWLIKFGFYYKEYNFYFFDLKNGYYLSYKLCLDYGDLEVCKGINSTCKVENLNFVHQLQNLYFALTQKELTTYDNNTTSN